MTQLCSTNERVAVLGLEGRFPEGNVGQRAGSIFSELGTMQFHDPLTPLSPLSTPPSHHRTLPAPTEPAVGPQSPFLLVWSLLKVPPMPLSQPPHSSHNPRKWEAFILL